MEFTADQIAKMLNGTIDGDSNVKVNKLVKIEEGEPGGISFLSNSKYTPYIYNTKASIVIINESFQLQKPVPEKCTLIRVKDAYQGFIHLLNSYQKIKEESMQGIEQGAHLHDSSNLSENTYVGALSYIGKNADIGENVKIYPSCHIGENVKIEDNSIIKPGAKVLNDCKIGKNCIIHSGTVIGSDGFGFSPDDSNYYSKIAQTGNVILEDNIEIGANCTIDRATLGSTLIKKGVKLDNLIQIAHNVEIGENTVIAAQTGIAGSTKVGKNCMIGGQVGIIGHLTIEDEVKIAAQSGIGNDIEEKGKIVQGSPAFDIKDFKKGYLMFKKLPDMSKKIDSLERELEQLKYNKDKIN